MKRKNMKVGLHVVIKEGAEGFVSKIVGQTCVIVSLHSGFEFGYVETPHGLGSVYPEEARKATPEEIAIYEQENPK